MSFNYQGKAIRILNLPTIDYEAQAKRRLYAKSDDYNSRAFAISLFDDNGILSLKKYDDCTLNALTPNGKRVFSKGEKQGNQAIFLIPSSLLKQSGQVICDVSLQGETDNGEKLQLTSQTFYLEVEQAVFDDAAVEGDDEYNLILRLKSEVKEIADEYGTTLNEFNKIKSDVAEKQNTYAENENLRINAENERIINEEARMNAEKTRKEREEARVAAETTRTENFNAVSVKLNADLNAIENVTQAAAEIKDIYASFPILLYYDENGFLCYEEKGEIE